MNRFALSEPTLVTVEHVNLRDEKHGDESVPAIDVKLSMETGSDVLLMFHPLLKSMLYFKSKHPQPPAEQGALDLEAPVEMPDLRWPFLDPLKWSEDLDNRTLTIDYGIGGKSALMLTDCKVNGFRIDPMQGGTVKLTWRVQRSQPDERAVGKLSSLLKHEVLATLTSSPETEALLAGQDDDSSADDDLPFEPTDATDAFVAEHAGSRDA